MKKASLKLRLIVFFGIISTVVWSMAALLSWYESREQLDEFFDTYQLMLARQFAAADWSNAGNSEAKKINRIIENLDDDGEEDDEALGFAVFDKDGKMVFHDGENGSRFPYIRGASGFGNHKIGKKHKLWRIVCLPSADGQYLIAVGQEEEFRVEAALDLIEETLLPWALGLGLILLCTVWMVHRELKPLKEIAADLENRSADDFSPLGGSNVPAELLPLIVSGNRLFARTGQMLQNERDFIADSAHELRSPLTALKVQLEVAELSLDDKNALHKAFKQLKSGIDRSSRLVEQLLALSRLNRSGSMDGNFEILDWKNIIARAVEEQAETADRKQITISLSREDKIFLTSGNSFLWSLLLRNLLDNAIRYSSEGASVNIELTARALVVSNTGVNVENTVLKNLGQRFFRPAGQKETGSGLGLSIVEKIASLHGCRSEYRCENGVFTVEIRRN